MTVFNGVDQGANITGITSGSAIRVKFVTNTAYSDDQSAYACVMDGRTTGNFLAEHLNDASLLARTNCSLLIDGVGASSLGSLEAPSGSEIQIYVSDGTKVGTSVNLFRQPGGFGALIIDTNIVEIWNGADDTLIHSFTLPTIVTSTTIADNIGSASLELINFTVAAGPTITGPDTTTEGAVTVQTGTLQDTVVTQSLVSGSNSVVQSIDSATAGTLNYVARSGVSLTSPMTAVAGIPFEATVAAAGITPYVVQQKADDGINPPATRNITLNPEATHNVVQTMIAAANTTPGESFFGTNILGVEDNHQMRIPKVVDTVTITIAADGTFTTDKDQTINFYVDYFAPSTGEWYPVAVTVRDTSITPTEDKKRKNRRQSQVYQYYLNKNWKNRFQG